MSMSNTTKRVKEIHRKFSSEEKIRIKDPVQIRTVLAHLNKKETFAADRLLPDCRASPSPPMGSLV